MSASDAERVARATLSLILEPGDWRSLSVVADAGAQLLVEGIADEERYPQFEAARARLVGADGAAELERAQAHGIRFVVPGDDEWPAQLDDLGDAEPVQLRGGVPIGLWVSGPLRLDQLSASVSVVGSRDSTAYGEQIAVDITSGIGRAGLTTISGAAIGIDYAAHRGAASVGAPTVAVLACGVDRDYPVRHAEMLRRLRAEHAVVSEVPMGGAPQRIRFLARNRLIAALSRGTVVVEAAARSGALNTMNWAQRLQRIAMGVPGPVTSVASLGVHHQLRSGGAALVTCASDVLELVGDMGTNLTEFPRGPDDERDLLELRDRQILDAVPVYRAVAAESIARLACVELTEVLAALPALEESGHVERDAGGWRLAESARR
ncbi:DNA-processing protein DprA [Nocardioides maradonensis]